MTKNLIRLGVNIDHVATVRQARKIAYPDPVEAALLAVKAGADGITLHLREDRRHIQDHDVERMKKVLTVPMNLEMALTEEMLKIAERIQPEHCCIVPEKREEVTTEGGLDVVGQESKVKDACKRLENLGIEVSLFIDPDIKQIEASHRCGAPVIEFHTGPYAHAYGTEKEKIELQKLLKGAELAVKLGLIVNAGHGLNCENVLPIASIPHMNELNIGHSLVADAIFIGMEAAVRRIKQLMDSVL